jgi:hypothetical protein
MHNYQCNNAGLSAVGPVACDPSTDAANQVIDLMTKKAAQVSLRGLVMVCWA